MQEKNKLLLLLLLLLKSLFLVTELTTGDVLTVYIDDIFEVTCFLPPIHLVMEDLYAGDVYVHVL